MSPRHVLKDLPLWAGSDLEPTRRAQVEAHLEACASCRAEADALREALAWIREDAEPPFDAADRRALRRDVMARVRQEALPRARPSQTWVLLPAAALLVAAVGLELRHLGKRPLPLPAQATPPSAQAQLRPVEAAAVPLRTVPARQRRPVDPEPPADPPPPAFTRLEFSTGDPAIRIIWLAQAAPAVSSSPSIQECP